MFRFKTIIGANLKSRSLANQKTESRSPRNVATPSPPPAGP